VIVLDTSALMAVILREPDAEACITALDEAAEITISAANLAEALIVAQLRNIGPEMSQLIEESGCEVSPVTESSARRVALAYARWGKGVHPAGLNFGDCFAYALADERGWPLLYVGSDFSRTDIVPAMPPR
jgi:ribonuclease VapC